MASLEVKTFLAQELSAWTLEGRVDPKTAEVLRARWDEPGFGITALVKYLGVVGGLLAVLGLLGLAATMSESLAVGGAVCLLVAVGFLWSGRLLWRDPRGRYPGSARVVLGLGVVAFGIGAGILASEAGARDQGLVTVVSLCVIALAGVLGYRYRIRFLVAVAVTAFTCAMGAWGEMFGRSSYALDISDPRWMLAGASLVFAVGLWHERALEARYPRFHVAYQVLGLLYVNLSLLILSLGRFEDTAGLVWSGVALTVAIAQIVAGTRLLSGLLTGFGVTFAVLEAVTIYGETCWAALDRGLFFLIGGAVLFACGLAFELRQRKARS